MSRAPRSLVRDLFLAVALLSLAGLALLTWQGVRGAAEILDAAGHGAGAVHLPADGPGAGDAPAAPAVTILRRLQSRLLAEAGISLGVALLLAAWLSLSLRRELGRLRRGAELLAAGRLDHLVDARGLHRELADLAQSLNRMAADLSRQVDALERERREQEALLAGMREGVLALDRRGRVRACNPAARRLLGLGSHPVGALLEDLVPERRALHDALRLGWRVGGHEWELAPDAAGRELRVWAQALPGSAGGEPVLLAVVSDMGAHNRAEHLRRDFVANVSHELKTPVTSIRGYAEMLREDRDLDEAARGRFLEVVERQARRLEAIIEDLLDLSRLERQAEEGPPARAPVPLRPLLERLLEDHLPQARQAAVRLRLEADPALPASLPAVAPLLERALANLLANALRYGRPETEVVVTAGPETRGGFPGVRLEVRDQGCGIAPAHLPRLFERFYVVDKARSRELGGTGLGLAIVKHAIQVQGGEVGAHSEEGRGSTFWLWLPA